MNTTSFKTSLTSSKDRLELICEHHRKFLLPNLKSFGRPSEPRKPGHWKNLDDGEIMNQIRDARDHLKETKFEKLSSHDKETLEWLGSWRGGVMRHEAKCEGNILTLLRAAASFDEAGDEETSFRLLMFACTEYGFHIPAAPTNDTERKAIARKHSHRPDLLPDRFLMEGHEPPRAQEQSPEATPSQIGFNEVI